MKTALVYYLLNTQRQISDFWYLPCFFSRSNWAKLNIKHYCSTLHNDFLAKNDYVMTS